jgi:integrase/recombinase XerC
MAAALAYCDAEGQLTVDWADVIDEYLTELAAAGRPATTVGLRSDQLRHMATSLRCPIDQVDRRVLLGWFADQVWAPETRRSYRSAARGFFGWAVARGYLVGDPAADLPVVPLGRAVPHPVPDEVYAAALAGAAPPVVLMLRLAAEAGLRRGEIARVHSQDVQLDGDGFSLLVHGKGAKDRLIPVPDELGAAIRAAHGWVFASPHGGHVSARWVGQVCGAALPGRWTLHGLRHRFATRAYAGSRDLRSVQELLGHSSPSVTQRYVAVTRSDLRAAMKAAAVGVLVGGLLLGCAADSPGCDPAGNALRVAACKSEML